VSFVATRVGVLAASRGVTCKPSDPTKIGQKKTHPNPWHAECSGGAAAAGMEVVVALPGVPSDSFNA